MRLTLKLVDGDVIEERVDSNVVVIGRSSKCTIQVPHEGMSRQHCQIEVINGEIFVTDLNSTNGVFIEGTRIEPNKRVPYNTFFQLSFGAVQSLQIDFEDVVTPVSRDSFKNSASSSVSQKEPTKPGLTKTKTIHQQNKNQNKKEKSSNINGKMVFNIVAVAIILLIIIWFLNRDEEASEYYYDSADEISTSYEDYERSNGVSTVSTVENDY